MNYTYHYHNQDYCDNLLNLQLTVFVIIFGITSLCVMCQPNKEMEELKVENKNLKKLVLKSFDKVFNDALKNGYDSDNDTDY